MLCLFTYLLVNYVAERFNQVVYQKSLKCDITDVHRARLGVITSSSSQLQLFCQLLNYNYNEKEQRNCYLYLQLQLLSFSDYIKIAITGNMYAQLHFSSTFFAKVKY